MRALSSSNGDRPGTVPGVQEMEGLLRAAVPCTMLAAGVCSSLSGLGLAGGTLMELLLAIMLFGKLGTGLGPFSPLKPTPKRLIHGGLHGRKEGSDGLCHCAVDGGLHGNRLPIMTLLLGLGVVM